MTISLRRFREILMDKLVESHWRQWAAFGLGTHIREEKNWLIDVEGLIPSTLYMGKFDKRLLTGVVEWIIKNGEWINLSRLKNVGKYFCKKDKDLKEPLIPEALFGLIGDILKCGEKGINKMGTNEIVYNLPEEYRDAFKDIKIKNITTEPILQNPVSLQLYLRGIFGINARAEILLYFVSKNGGNSNQIAREIYYNQKIVYRILQRWVKTGFVEKEQTKKESIYSVRRGQTFFGWMRQSDIPSYINWGRFFCFFAKVSEFLHTPSCGEDEYLVSSFFRNILEEAKAIGKYVNVSFPDSGLYKGSDFFQPFASRILDVLKEIEAGIKKKRV